MPCKSATETQIDIMVFKIVHFNDKTLSLFKIPLKRFKSPTPPMPCHVTHHAMPPPSLLLFLHVNDE